MADTRVLINFKVPPELRARFKVLLAGNNAIMGKFLTSYIEEVLEDPKSAKTVKRLKNSV